MELRSKYAESIQKLIRLRSVEYLVITHGYPYREELRRKIREASREVERAQKRFLEESRDRRPGDETWRGAPLDYWFTEADRLAAAKEAARDFTPEEVAALERVRKCLEAVFIPF